MCKQRERARFRGTVCRRGKVHSVRRRREIRLDIVCLSLFVYRPVPLPVLNTPVCTSKMAVATHGIQPVDFMKPPTISYPCPLTVGVGTVRSRGVQESVLQYHGCRESNTTCTRAYYPEPMPRCAAKFRKQKKNARCVMT